VMILVNGMRKTSVLNCLICWTENRKRSKRTCFPISNWTELDVWSYIEQEQIEIPSIYFFTQA
jgi:3'-phosphoadenosine 5'-phosphosulfate sulfotransferase (PAPS reductase)/FAD synthetase